MGWVGQGIHLRFCQKLTNFVMVQTLIAEMSQKHKVFGTKFCTFSQLKDKILSDLQVQNLHFNGGTF